jgi:hypothetical protein
MFAASNACSVDLAILNKSLHHLIALTLVANGLPRIQKTFTCSNKVNKGMSLQETAQLMAPFNYTSKIDANYER